MSSKYQAIEQELAARVMGWEYTQFFDSTPEINGKPTFHMKDDGVYVRDPLNGYSTHWQPSENIEQAMELLQRVLTRYNVCMVQDATFLALGAVRVTRTGSLTRDIVRLVELYL